ncbi:MAG: GuaB3 family IMP dehydrogenase-related protein [Candidatus Omnitrophica bacterium]|nr:GuaB3 family IMP dehydrogenase-related protein [Candidatus Omnitrophota bacterium]MBI3009632.1 GuaB3 family IMP dehydrogenase-related protein [Candidatus Omnitrophota bacterium]
MAEWIGIGRRARRCYGFDEIALVPGTVSLNAAEVDASWKLRDLTFRVPIIASAMDGVVDVTFAITMGKLGALAVLNLDGVQCRYENPAEAIGHIIQGDVEKTTNIVQQLYKEPIQEKLIAKRIEQIKSANVPCAVSTIPQNAERFGAIAQEAGADIFVVQSTVTTARHIATIYKPLDFPKFFKTMRIPVIVGNCVTSEQGLELMDAGADALLVGVGPGAACTTRGVLGVGVPQVTATVDVASARDFYFKKSSRYVPIITDGGMRNGGDICKAFACGSDAVMVGSAFAKAKEAPGRGFHWGMAYPHSSLPRGTRIFVGTTGTLEQILFGPALTDDGSQNLMGALTTCMGTVGAKDIKAFQLTEIIIAPSIQTEGKSFQQVQRVGMARKSTAEQPASRQKTPPKARTATRA